jgi:D-xylose 1-dehydrogenase (NADP+, D-xylono-1,5-lactone-forming)
VPEPLRWGVIGATSKIAQQAVLPALQTSASSEVAAVASLSGADYDTFGAASIFDSYEGLLADESVECVYIPLPNNLHKQWTITAVEAGKHVLCEKPLAVTGTDADEMFEAARAAGVLLVEAYVTPYHPRTVAVKELLLSGSLGEVRAASSTFSFPLEPDNHRWRPEMGGGALLDLGVYCISPLLLAGGRPPQACSAAGHMTQSGVDATFSGFLDFGDGVAAGFTCSFDAPFNQRLEITCGEATVAVPHAFSTAAEETEITLLHRGGDVETVDVGPIDRPSYQFMLERITSAVREGARLEHGREEVIELAGIIDALRREAGARS